MKAIVQSEKFKNAKTTLRAYAKTRIGLTVTTWVAGLILCLVLGLPLALINRTYELVMMVFIVVIRKLVSLQTLSTSLFLQLDHSLCTLCGLSKISALSLFPSGHYLLPLAVLNRPPGHRLILYFAIPGGARHHLNDEDSDFHCDSLEHHILG